MRATTPYLVSLGEAMCGSRGVMHAALRSVWTVGSQFRAARVRGQAGWCRTVALCTCAALLAAPSQPNPSLPPSPHPPLPADWFTACVKFIEQRGQTPLAELAQEYGVKDGKLAKLEAFPAPPGDAPSPPSDEELEAVEAAAAFEEASAGAVAAAAAGGGTVLAQPPSAAPVVGPAR